MPAIIRFENCIVSSTFQNAEEEDIRRKINLFHFSKVTYMKEHVFFFDRRA
jgi:hypothetical protein